MVVVLYTIYRVVTRSLSCQKFSVLEEFVLSPIDGWAKVSVKISQIVQHVWVWNQMTTFMMFFGLFQLLPFQLCWCCCVVLQEEDLEKKSEMKVDIQEGPPPSSSWSFGSRFRA